MRIENKVFCCDNLELLKRLPSSCIDLIYCDVLFGTGGNFGQYQDIKKKRQIIENFYLPRIRMIYKVLKKTGSIYLQCDWRITHYLRLMLDNIFNENNFQNEIIWFYYNAGGGASKKHFKRKHQTILFYTKNSLLHTFNQARVRKKHIDEYKCLEDKKGKFTWMIRPGTNRKVPNGVKNYLYGYMQDVWYIPIINIDSKERRNNRYPTQKPIELLERIILASSNKGDIVADFFCGSGTTGVVCKRHNRKYLLCDNSEEAIKVTKERLRKERIPLL